MLMLKVMQLIILIWIHIESCDFTLFAQFVLYFIWNFSLLVTRNSLYNGETNMQNKFQYNEFNAMTFCSVKTEYDILNSLQVCEIRLLRDGWWGKKVKSGWSRRFGENVKEISNTLFLNEGVKELEGRTLCWEVGSCL